MRELGQVLDYENTLGKALRLITPWFQIAKTLSISSELSPCSLLKPRQHNFKRPEHLDMMPPAVASDVS